MRRGALAAAGGGALVALALLRAGGGGPAIYDGICAPVTYLKLGANPGPMPTTKVVHAGQADNVATPETVPQAQVIFPPASFPLSAGTPVTVTVKPIPPPASRPGDGAIDGNVYAVTAAGPDGKPVDLAGGQQTTVGLETTGTAGSQLAIELFDGARWTKLTTVQSGCGTTELANTSRLGDFALVALGSTGGGGGTGPAGSSGPPWALIVVAVALVLFALLIIGLRRGRRRAGSPGARRSRR